MRKEVGSKRTVKYRKCARKKNQNGRMQCECETKRGSKISSETKKVDLKMSNYYIKIHLNFWICVHISPKFEGNFQIPGKCISSSENML